MPDIAKELKGKNATQLREMLVAKSDAFENFLKPHRFEKDGAVSYDLTIAEAEEMRSMNEELTEIGKAYDGMRDIEKIASEQKARADRIEREPVNKVPFQTNDSKPDQSTQVKSIGQMFVESAEYKESLASKKLCARMNGGCSVEIAGAFEFKTTMTTGAGFAPANFRTDIVIPSAQRRPVFQDYIPQTPTDLDSVKYMEETTFTNNTASTAENAALGEVALAYTERTTPVETIGGFLPVTEQQLEIAESIRGLLDNRLMLMQAIREEIQLLTGSGTTPQLVGFLNKSGIQTQAKGADPTPDAVYKLITKLRGGSGDGFIEPSLLVFHPNDWQDIRLLRDANGNYIWGNPAEAGPERMWGKPVLTTVSETEGTILTGDFPLFSEIYRKRGMRVDVGWQNDDFVKLKMTIRISSRLALLIYRASAFGTVTGA